MTHAGNGQRPGNHQKTVLRRLQSGRPPVLIDDGPPTVPILQFARYRREWDPGRRGYASPKAWRESLFNRVSYASCAG